MSDARLVRVRTETVMASHLMRFTDIFQVQDSTPSGCDALKSDSPQDNSLHGFVDAYEFTDWPIPRLG